MTNSRKLQMKSPTLVTTGPKPQSCLGFLVGEKMNTQGTDEELKETTDEESHTGYYQANTSSVAWSFWLENR